MLAHITPKMPTAHDEARAQVQRLLYALAVDDWREVLEEYVEQMVGPERAASWGPVDTSVNDLADFAGQVGALYTRRPTVLGPEGTDRLVDVEGLLDAAGWWQKAAHVEYMAIAMGDFLVRPSVNERGQIGFRAVAPQNVYAEADPDDPTRPIKLKELRWRFVEELGEALWCWDCYDIRPGREAYRIEAAESRVFARGARRVVEGEDLSAAVLATPGAPYEPFVGERYPFRRRGGNGFPYIPFVWYRAADTLSLWGHDRRRGPAQGTLNGGLLSTYSLQAARDATGMAVLAWGLEPITGDAQNVGQPNQLRSINLKPGAMMYHRTAEDARQVGVKEVGPGARLESLKTFTDSYHGRGARRFGLKPSTATRASGNPTSAAALRISDEERREFIAGLTPLFRRADQRLIGIVASLWNQNVGKGEIIFAESGYSVVYAPIPKTPDEKEAEREEVAYLRGNGMLSKVQAFQRFHPGATREAALEALAQVARDEAELAAASEPRGEPARALDEGDVEDIDEELTEALAALDGDDLDAARESIKEAQAILLDVDNEEEGEE